MSPPTRHPTCGFDLVHARLVLTHVPRRAVALRRMAGALRPGGWLVVEDFDVSAQPLACPDAADDDEERANRIRAGFIELLAARSVDLSLGRTLRHRLRSLGLADVRAEAYAPLALPATRALERANMAQVRDGLVALGLGDDIDAAPRRRRRRHHRRRHAAAGARRGAGESEPRWLAGTELGREDSNP